MVFTLRDKKLARYQWRYLMQNVNSLSTQKVCEMNGSKFRAKNYEHFHKRWIPHKTIAERYTIQ